MLKVMRSQFKQLKWILVFVVFLFVLLVFVDWGAGGATGGGQTVRSYAARVNGETISLRDYSRALWSFEKNYEQLYGQNLTEEMREALGLREMVMNQLVEQTLLLQEAERLNLTATPAEIRQEILQMSVLNPNGQFVGAELYQRYVTGQLGYPTTADFEADLARSITLEKMQSILSNSVVIPPAVAENEYRRKNEKATIRYALFPANQAVEQVAVTPAEIEAHYRTNEAQYAHPEQRRVKYLVADLGRIRAEMNPSEAELRAHYEQNRSAWQQPERIVAQHILINSDQNATPADDAAARRKADEIMAQIRAGADFAELARKHSDDPGSAAEGGALPPFGRGQMVPQFEEAAFTTSPGEVSEVVKSQFGYHIVKVNDKRAGGIAPFEEVRGQVEQQLIEEGAKTQAREKIARIRAQIAQANVKDEEAIRKFTDDTVSYNDTEWFSQNDAIQGIGQNKELTDWAFSSSQGEMGPIVESLRGPIIPWVSGARPAGIAPLAEVREKVEADAKMAKARAQAAETMKQAVAGASSLDEVATRLSLSPVEVVVSREGFVPGLGPNVRPLVDATFAAAPGQLAGPVTIDTGAVAFEVVSHQKVSPAEFEQQRVSFTESLRQNEAVKLRASLLNKLRREAKVDVNGEVLTYADGTGG